MKKRGKIKAPYPLRWCLGQITSILNDRESLLRSMLAGLADQGGQVGVTSGGQGGDGSSSGRPGTSDTAGAGGGGNTTSGGGGGGDRDRPGTSGTVSLYGVGGGLGDAGGHQTTTSAAASATAGGSPLLGVGVTSGIGFAPPSLALTRGVASRRHVLGVTSANWGRSMRSISSAQSSNRPGSRGAAGGSGAGGGSSAPTGVVGWDGPELLEPLGPELIVLGAGDEPPTEGSIR